MTEIRVCHVVNAVDETTGPANHATALAKYTDIDPGLLAWFSAERFDEDDLIEVHSLDAPQSFLGVGAISKFRQAETILSEYDIIHTHHPHSATIAKLIGKLKGKGLVFTSGTVHSSFTRAGRISNGITNIFADRLTCVSPSVYLSYSWWERWLTAGKRVRVIYTGVDLEKIDRSRGDGWNVKERCEIPPSTFLVGHAGRLSEAKAQDVLIRAIGKAREYGLDVALVIAGDGEQRHALHQLVRQQNLGDVVHFTGLLTRQDVYAMLQDCDVLAMPSRWEGFSSTVIEAMALDTPCILSEIPAFKEPFEGVAAFHDVDDPRSLADGIILLATDEKIRRKFATRGRNLVARRFTMEQTAHAYERLYEELLD